MQVFTYLIPTFIYAAEYNKMNLVLLPVETYCCVSVSSVYFFLFKAGVLFFFIV